MLRAPVNRATTSLLLLVLFLSAGLAAAPVWASGRVSDDVAFFTLPVIGLALGLAVTSLLSFFTKCIHCGSRILWQAVSTESHSKGLRSFFEAELCPNCGRDRNGLKR